MDLPQMQAEMIPENYFTQYLPSLFEEHKESIGGSIETVNVAISYQLVGMGGGTWTLKVESGKLKGIPGETSDRTFKIIQKVEDWREAIAGNKGFKVDLLNREQNGDDIDVNLLNETKIDRLKKIDGVIKFQLTEPGAIAWEITAVFGSANPEEPNCTISLTSTDARAIRNGEMSPQIAFMSGKINIHGDIGFAMLIGAALTE